MVFIELFDLITNGGIHITEIVLHADRTLAFHLWALDGKVSRLGLIGCIGVKALLTVLAPAVG